MKPLTVPPADASPEVEVAKKGKHMVGPEDTNFKGETPKPQKVAQNASLVGLGLDGDDLDIVAEALEAELPAEKKKQKGQKAKAVAKKQASRAALQVPRLTRKQLQRRKQLFDTEQLPVPTTRP